MLKVQEYLRSGKTLDDLTQEYAIKVAAHETLPLVILNYHQLDSPKNVELARECRGVVLEKETWKLVAKGFNRFFRIGEMPEEDNKFDWNAFYTQEKVDGSLVLIYYYGGKWRANTRGSFAEHQIEDWDLTWQQVICKAMGVESLERLNVLLSPSYTYVCELCSPYNKVVRLYKESQLFLLTVFQGERELLRKDVYEEYRATTLFKLPEEYSFHSYGEISDFILQQQEKDPTFEGVVACDLNKQRNKIKSPTWLALSRLRNQNGAWNKEGIIAWILADNEQKLIDNVPELSDLVTTMKVAINYEYIILSNLWAENRHKESQKEFALSIIKSKFSSILFDMRKKKEDNLSERWRKAQDLIYKVLFKCKESV